VAGEPPDRMNVPWLIGIRMKCEIVWNSPQENLVHYKHECPVCEADHTFPSSDAEAIRESLNGFLFTVSLARHSARQSMIPISVKDGGGVASEEGEALGELPALLERDDGERAAATSLPIDGQVVGVCLESGVSVAIRRDWIAC
jgi:hypothetical protein